MVSSNRESLGRRSLFADYCVAQKKGLTGECIFHCIREGEDYYATDVPVGENKPTLGLDVLDKASRSWWKRFSLYSAVTVQQVQMRFMSVKPAGLAVCIVSLDYADDMQDLRREIDRQLQDVERGCGGVDIDGNISKCHGCANEIYDGDVTYCKYQHCRKLRQMHTEYKWLPSTLRYWWRNGVDAKGLRFLRSAGFVYSYEELQYDKYNDAASPYGRSISAFLLVEGWNVRYILILTGLTILGSACVIAIMAARTGSLDNALTAGSYACGLGATLIAVLTLLSALLR